MNNSNDSQNEVQNKKSNAKNQLLSICLLGVIALWIVMQRVDMSAITKGIITLIALLASLVIAVLVKKISNGNKRPTRELSILFRRKSKFSRVVHIVWGALICAISVYSASSYYVTARAEANGSKLALTGVLALFVLLSGIAWFAMILRSNLSSVSGSGVKSGSGGKATGQGVKDEFLLCGFILSLTPCYGLLVIYRENAANPHLAAYAWQIAALAAVAAAFMFLTGFSVSKEYHSPAYTLFFSMCALTFCAGAQSSISARGASAMYMFYTFAMLYIGGQVMSAMMDGRLSDGERELTDAEIDNNELDAALGYAKSGAGELPVIAHESEAEKPETTIESANEITAETINED